MRGSYDAPTPLPPSTRAAGALRGRLAEVTSRFGTLTGRLRFSGSTVTFSHESEGSLCPTKVGKYRFKITGKTLKLTKISDPCGVRVMVHSPKYTKIG